MLRILRADHNQIDCIAHFQEVLIALEDGNSFTVPFRFHNARLIIFYNRNEFEFLRMRNRIGGVNRSSLSITEYSNRFHK